MEGLPIDEQTSEDRPVRLDQWLWSVRLYKTRNQAATACRLGQVLTAGGSPVKASRAARAGDEFEVVRGPLRRHVRVVAPLSKRVGAKLVAGYMEDLTSDEAWEAARRAAAERRSGAVFAEGSEGRPTKRQRRRLDAFLEEVERASRL